MPGFLLERAGLFSSALWRRLAWRHPAPPRTRQSLQFPELEREVWNCRDECGVPQIYAETLGDLAFGTQRVGPGLDTARDLWFNLLGGLLGILLLRAAFWRSSKKVV